MKFCLKSKMIKFSVSLSIVILRTRCVHYWLAGFFTNLSLRVTTLCSFFLISKISVFSFLLPSGNNWLLIIGSSGDLSSETSISWGFSVIGFNIFLPVASEGDTLISSVCIGLGINALDRSNEYYCACHLLPIQQALIVDNLFFQRSLLISIPWVLFAFLLDSLANFQLFERTRDFIRIHFLLKSQACQFLCNVINNF